MPTEFIQSLLSSTWGIALAVFFFCASIFVHELGHFLAARKRGLKIERFSIGFGPKMFGWQGKDGVEYRVSWLPLGGYVALPQLADMRGVEGETSANTDALPPISYADKMIVAVMGAVFNMIFALALGCIIWVFGQPTTAERQTTQIGFVEPEFELPDKTKVPSPAATAGLLPGDTILRIDGIAVSDWSEMQQTLYAGSGRTPTGEPMAIFTIRRGEREIDLVVKPRLFGEERFRRIGIAPAETMRIAEVSKDSAAAAAGLIADDVIQAVNDAPVMRVEVFRQAMATSKGSEVTIRFTRGNTTQTATLIPREETNPKTNEKFYRAGIAFDNGYTLIYPDPITQFTDTARMTFRILGSLISPSSDLGLSHMSGPPGIIRAFHVTAQIDLRLVVWLAILVNINLAIFNLLPIPVLDGGHMLFATIGKLRGAPLPAQFIQGAQTLFMLILFGLMIYVSFFDIRRWVRDATTTPEQQERATPINP